MHIYDIELPAYSDGHTDCLVAAEGGGNGL